MMGRLEKEASANLPRYVNKVNCFWPNIFLHPLPPISWDLVQITIGAWLSLGLRAVTVGYGIRVIRFGYRSRIGSLRLFDYTVRLWYGWTPVWAVEGRPYAAKFEIPQYWFSFFRVCCGHWVHLRRTRYNIFEACKLASSTQLWRELRSSGPSIATLPQPA